MYCITELAESVGLSRSTLLYYHRIGLLAPSARSRANYRRYSEADRQRLEAICSYRRLGLSLADIRTLLGAEPVGSARILERRLRELDGELQELQARRRLLADMLQVKARGWQDAFVDKPTWVAILRAAGLDDEAMEAWHREFEQQAPEAHEAFLRSLGLTEAEILGIRKGTRPER